MFVSIDYGSSCEAIKKIPLSCISSVDLASSLISSIKVDQDGNYIEDHWDFCSFVDPIEDPIDPLRPTTTWGGGEECENPCSGQKCDEVVAK